MNFNLSSKEFLFLLFALGAKQVYGIENVFANINAEDMFTEINGIENSLETKNYIESDFDGNSSINETLISYINVCVNYSYMAFLNYNKNTDERTVFYYFNEETVIKAEKENETYIINMSSKDDFLQDIETELSFKARDVFNDETEYMILQTTLEKIMTELKLGNKDSAKELLQGLKDDVSNIIVSALEEKEDFYSITVIDTKSKENNIESLMIIDTSKGLVALQPDVMNMENAVKIKPCSCKETKNFINKIINPIVN